MGFCHNVIPWFAVIERPLMIFTRKEVTLIGFHYFRKHFVLKEYLDKEPILKYPDPSNPYQGGLLRGNQLNWVALTKEAHAIYISIKKLVYYLERCI